MFDVNAILWAGLVGGIAGALGAMIGFLLTRGLGGKSNPGLVGGIAGGFAVAAGILAQHVSPQMVGDLLGLEALSASEENRARAGIEREIMALPPEQRERMLVIGEVAPQLYEQIISDAVELELNGGSEAEGAAVIRQRIADELASRMPGLNDAEFVTWAELQTELHEVLIPRHNEFCMLLATGQLSALTPDDLPVRFAEVETEVFRLAFGSEGEGGEVLPAEQSAAIVNTAVSGLVDNFTTEDIQSTFGYFGNPVGEIPENGCAVFVGYMRGLQDNLDDQAGPFWRTMMAAG